MVVELSERVWQCELRGVDVYLVADDGRSSTLLTGGGSDALRALARES